ncbi:MAG TPA: alpha/beta hydrolase [Verrucomicrobiae bacterium]
MAQSANLQRWTNSAGQPIGFKHLSPTQPAEGSILVTYGNAASAIDCAHYAGDIQPVAAMDIYILEYPGYEDRPGSPTETKIFQAGEDAFQSIPTNHPIYLVGESLGTGPASYLAGTFSNRVAGIALISPFDTLASPARYEFPYLPVSLLLMDRFSSVDYLQNYHGKIAIAVDGADEIVPTKSGLRLYDSYNGPKKLWEFKNAGHCQIYSPVSEFWKGVVDFWRSSP